MEITVSFVSYGYVTWSVIGKHVGWECSKNSTLKKIFGPMRDKTAGY
jgi:hypothetical protein